MQRGLVSDAYFYVLNQFRVARQIYTSGLNLTNLEYY